MIRYTNYLTNHIFDNVSYIIEPIILLARLSSNVTKDTTAPGLFRGPLGQLGPFWTFGHFASESDRPLNKLSDRLESNFSELASTPAIEHIVSYVTSTPAIEHIFSLTLMANTWLLQFDFLELILQLLLSTSLVNP